MNKILLLLRQQNVFTTDWFKESDYYKRSIYESRKFRSNTIRMVCSVLMGIFVLNRFWRELPWTGCFLVIFSLCCIFLVWERVIREHRKTAAHLRNMSSNGLPDELIQVASGEANFGAAALYIVTLALMTALGLALKHCHSIAARPH